MSRRRGTPPGDYPVGYKRPPAASRFKKGQSGNPKGRTKGALTTSDLFLREASRFITVKSGESVRQIPKREALVRRLIDMSIQGDLAAARLVLPLMFGAEAEASEAAAHESAPPAPLSDAERAAMKILVERLSPDGDNG